MAVFTVFIEWSLNKTISEIFEGVVPVRLCSEGMIKDGRIPFITGRKDNMW